jgi:hypothetical protein
MSISRKCARTARAAVVAAACVAAAAGCADPPPPEPGTFTVTVSGAEPEELKGTAVAWTAPSGERRSYEVRLQLPGDASTSIVFATIGRRRPREGAYAVTEQAPDSATFDMLYNLGEGGRQVVKGTGGEIVIKTWDRRHVAGGFDVIGRLLDLDAPGDAAQTVRVTGTFTAPCMDADGGAC